MINQHVQLVSDTVSPIWESAVNGDWNTVKEWLQGGSSINDVTGEGMLGKREYKIMSLLHLALTQENPDLTLVEYLVSRGADVNAHLKVREQHGDGGKKTRILLTPSPLHFAVWSHASIAVLQYLISQGANVNDKKQGVGTPLHWAVQRDSSIEVLQFLLSAGADVHVKDLRGNTPLDVANKTPLDYTNRDETIRILRDAMV
jgi:ankyrin repeat protein